MPLILTPDIPTVYNVPGDCDKSPPVQLDCYLGDAISWTVDNSWAGGNCPFINRKSPYTTWQQSCAKSGSFTPPTVGCYIFAFALNDTYHGIWWRNKWLQLAVKVHPPRPVAAFEGFPTGGDRPLTVLFTDESLNAPTSWIWNFGDGLLSAEQNPTHIYNIAGIYSVVLSATNANGTGTLTKTDYITVVEPPPPPPYVEPIWTLKIGPI